MMRPGAGAANPYLLIAIGAAFSMAFTNIIIRLMAPTEPSNRILFCYHIGAVSNLILADSDRCGVGADCSNRYQHLDPYDLFRPGIFNRRSERYQPV